MKKERLVHLFMTIGKHTYEIMDINIEDLQNVEEAIIGELLENGK